MTSVGTKVKDPHSIIKEPAGPVASDSLAAESKTFVAENRDSQPSDAPGSTFANTDTSAAKRLDPAPDAEARMAEDDWAEEKKLGAVGSYQKDSGRETGQKDSSNAGVAPTYVQSQYIDGGGPKGKNLKEGGFESDDAKNASFNTEIGSEKDPGRLAEQKFQRENAESANDAGLPRDKSLTGGTPYDTLSAETSA